jgi:hypothetical protein
MLKPARVYVGALGSTVTPRHRSQFSTEARWTAYAVNSSGTGAANAALKGNAYANVFIVALTGLALLRLRHRFRESIARRASIAKRRE